MSDLVKKLTQAKQLFDAGVLSETEYQELRKRYMEEWERSEATMSEDLDEAPTDPSPKAEPKPFVIDLFQGLNPTSKSPEEADRSEEIEKSEDEASEDAE